MFSTLERALRTLEVLAEVDLLRTAGMALAGAFGLTPEFKMAEVLAMASEPMPLSEIAARSGSTRRALSPLGSLRLALLRMERTGMAVNLGSQHRPLYQLNLLNDQSKLLAATFQTASTFKSG